MMVEVYFMVEGLYLLKGEAWVQRHAKILEDFKK